MDDNNKVEVVIGGRVYTLRGNESESYIQDVARYLDRKLSEINKLKGSRPVTAALFPIFLALNVADDFFKERNISNELRKQLETISKNDENLIKAKNEAEKYKRDLQKVRQELEKTKKELVETKLELNEYIENFDKK